MAFTIVIFFIACLVGLGVGIWLGKRVSKKEINLAQRKAQDILKEAEQQAELKRKEAALKAREELYKLKEEFNKEIEEKRSELLALEKRLQQRELNLDKRSDYLDSLEEELEKREKEIMEKESFLLQKESELSRMLEQEHLMLEKIAQMTSEEAKLLLLQKMEEEAKLEFAKRLKQMEEELREESQKKAQEILSLAIQRYAGDYVIDNTVTLVNLPNEEMKGRIIGREGRNIRAFEAATGVDLIIDDTPEAVILSSFDPIRREIARLALERLVADGRIHPARIEEVVSQVKEEFERHIKELGNRAAFDLGLHDLHPELLKLIGRLRYRTSYGQNVYQHSLEVAFLAGIMASELNMNVKLAKRSGLLHDIGKAVDHELEGTHASIGAELAKKYGEPEEVVKAIAIHHDPTPSTLLSVLVQAADALSSARPGARREMYESYIRRLQELEELAKSFPGVDKVYAIQAGREVRVMVQSDKVSDEQALLLSHEIARKIERELRYPGQIKVTVIREVRAIEYAK